LMEILSFNECLGINFPRSENGVFEMKFSTTHSFD